MNDSTTLHLIRKFMQAGIMEDELPIDTDVLCIDGTKYEANANKITFIWRKNTVRHRERQWKTVSYTHLDVYKRQLQMSPLQLTLLFSQLFL